MARRSKLRRSQSRKIFKRGAGVHKKNGLTRMIFQRGGVRL